MGKGHTPAREAVSTHVISLTVFDEDGRLDESGFRAHLQRLAAARIGVYVGGGGSGEGYTLDQDETRRVYEIAADELAGRVPVRAMGVEPRTSSEYLRLAQLARNAGLDALQVYPVDIGHGIQPSDSELERYFHEVLEATELPVVLSTHFALGYLVPIPLLQRLVERFDHVIGINCTTHDTSYVTRVVSQFAPYLEVHVGAPEQGLLCMLLGGHGFLSAEGNLVPELCVEVVDHFAAQRHDELHQAFARLVRLHCLGSEFWGLGGVTGIKAALKLLGLPGGPPRPPRLAVPEQQRSRLSTLLTELDVLSRDTVG